MSVRILQGDCLDVLKTLPDESVHMVCTSPPYWGLRDYGIPGSVWGGDPACAHEWGAAVINNAASYKEGTKARWNHRENGRGEQQAHMIDRAGWERKEVKQGAFCKCGAWRGALGLEPAPQLYVENMVAVFREVRRVLRDDGTLWLNLGDSYASHPNQRDLDDLVGTKQATNAGSRSAPSRSIDDLPAKNLVGIPWRVAFDLQADGWYLRQDIIWSKPNPMPESVRDRCTKAHEYLFLLAKSERYYFDQTGITEPCTSAYDPDDAKAPDGCDTGEGGHGTIHRLGREKGKSGNKARKPASARGVPMRKDQTAHIGHAIQSGFAAQASHHPTNGDVAGSVPWEGTTRNKRSVWTVTTKPFKEAHFATFPPALIEPCILAGCPAGGTVLDPFFGAGTTGLVADRLGRDCIGIELNPQYVEMARKRIKDDAPMFAEVV